MFDIFVFLGSLFLIQFHWEASIALFWSLLKPHLSSRLRLPRAFSASRLTARLFAYSSFYLYAICNFSILLSIISSHLVLVFVYPGYLLLKRADDLIVKSLPLLLSCLNRVRSELLYWPSVITFIWLVDSFFVAFLILPTMKLSWRIFELGTKLLLIINVIFI